MTQQIVKVAKKGKSAHSLDPNDFVFHSEYNTFKIIKEGTKTATLSASTNNQSITVAHELDWIPIVHAFAKRSGVDKVFAPNGFDIEIWGGKVGMSGDITFNYVQSDNTNITFNFDNAKANTVDISIRYFVLERAS